MGLRAKGGSRFIYFRRCSLFASAWCKLLREDPLYRKPLIVGSLHFDKPAFYERSPYKRASSAMSDANYTQHAIMQTARWIYRHLYIDQGFHRYYMHTEFVKYCSMIEHDVVHQSLFQSQRARSVFQREVQRSRGIITPHTGSIVTLSRALF